MESPAAEKLGKWRNHLSQYRFQNTQVAQNCQPLRKWSQKIYRLGKMYEENTEAWWRGLIYSSSITKKKQTNVSPEWNHVEPAGLVVQVMSHAETSKGTHSAFYYLLSSSQSEKCLMCPVTLQKTVVLYYSSNSRCHKGKEEKDRSNRTLAFIIYIQAASILL